jgi:hypothetical protein
VARQQGLDEDAVSWVTDDYQSSPLPDRYKVALAWTDAVLDLPSPVGDDVRLAVQDEFGAEQLVELTVGVGLFRGFSKMVIALGLEPDGRPPTVMSTPDRDHLPTLGEVIADLGAKDPDAAGTSGEG